MQVLHNHVQGLLISCNNFHLCEHDRMVANLIKNGSEVFGFISVLKLRSDLLGRKIHLEYRFPVFVCITLFRLLP